MPATKSQPIAREAYLAATDELVARLGKEAALHFMRQTVSAVAGKPSVMSSRRMQQYTVRQRFDVFAASLEAHGK
jgi:hypothetical protein